MKIDKIQKGIKTLEDDALLFRQIIEEICKTQDKLNELIEAFNKANSPTGNDTRE